MWTGSSRTPRRPRPEIGGDLTKRRWIDLLGFIGLIIMIIYYSRTENAWIQWFCNLSMLFSMILSLLNYLFCRNKKLDENPRALHVKIQSLWPYANHEVLPERVSAFFYAIIMVQSFFAGLYLVSTAHLVMAYCEGKMHQMAAERIDMNEIRRQVFEKIKAGLAEAVSPHQTDDVKIDKPNKIGYLHRDEKPPK